MKNYLVLSALALALIIPASAGAAVVDTLGQKVAVPPELIGKSGCGLTFGDDGVAEYAAGQSRAICVTIQAGDLIVATSNAGGLLIGVSRQHSYSTQTYLSVGILGTLDTQGAWTQYSDVRVFSYSRLNKPQCPTGGQRQDGTIGPIRGTGHPDFWSSPQGLSDMTTMCGLTVTDCDPYANCGKAPAQATTPVAATPPATQTPKACAAVTVKRTKIVVKQVGGSCTDARAVMSKYVKTGKDQTGYVCVKIATKKLVVAKCKSIYKAKQAKLITGSWAKR